MMMYAVAEENPLGICHELRELFTVAVALIIGNYVFQHLPHSKVMPAVLCPYNVTAIFCRLTQMIDIFLLSEAEIVPSRNPVPHYLEVRKFVDKIFKVIFLRRFVRTRDQGCGQACNCCHSESEFHTILIIYFQNRTAIECGEPTKIINFQKNRLSL